MKAAELRQSILQAAVYGKLVPQNPQDEPASRLFEKIQKEKTSLIKEGKIKKEKPLPEIVENEMPFEIPKNWCWVRLGNLTELITSGSRDWAKYYAPTGDIFLRMGNLSRNKFDLRLDKIQHVKLPQNIEGTRTSVQAGDLLFSITGEVGTLGLIPDNFGTAYINQHTAMIRFMTSERSKFYPYLLLSDYAQKFYNGNQHGIKNSFRLDTIALLPVPLPPLEEQHRIVSKIDELFALCDKLETEEKKLDALEAHFTEYLPKSILQEAVRGKLVPQDAHDEPASELLKRIQKEKAQLIKDGKIKKEKPLPSISEGEIPYDLPEGWVWCRLGEISDLRIGKTPARADERYWNNGKYPWVSIADMENGKWIYNTKECVSSEAYNIVFKQNLVSAGSLLFSFKLTIGKVSILGMDAFTNEAICAITPIGEKYIATYLFNVLPALDLLSGANSAVKGKTLNSKSLSNIITPLPPLEEQYRIVAKIEELFALCNEMKAAYTEPVEFDKVAETIPFPVPVTIEQPEESAEPLLLAARGVVENMSPEALKAMDDLFAEETE